MKLTSINTREETTIDFYRMAKQIQDASKNIANDISDFYSSVIYFSGVVFILSEIGFYIYVNWKDFTGVQLMFICFGVISSGTFFLINIALINRNHQ